MWANGPLKAARIDAMEYTHTAEPRNIELYEKEEMLMLVAVEMYSRKERGRREERQVRTGQDRRQ